MQALTNRWMAHFLVAFFAITFYVLFQNQKNISIMENTDKCMVDVFRNVTFMLSLHVHNRLNDR